MRLDVAATVVLDLVVIVVLARLLGLFARWLGQPAVIGEIFGGILLGPTLFGGAISRMLFPADVRLSLTVLANVGVCVFMFLVGLRLDRTLISGKGRITAAVSVGSIVVPFGFGVLLALWLAENHPGRNQLGFVLFFGVAMSVTAFPVLARILTDRRLIDTPIGGVALTCAAVDDVLAWTMLAVVAALAEHASAWLVLLVFPFIAVMLWVVRPLLARLAERQERASRLAGAAVLVVVAIGLWLSVTATTRMGLHAFFGAFLFGVVMPRQGATVLREQVLPWIEKVCSILLLPVFFMIAGLAVDLSTVDRRGLGELGLILLVAVGGKFGGGFAGALGSGIRVRHSAVLAILLNTRGLTELIALTVGLQLGVLDRQLYSLLVVMAVITTSMTGVLLRLVYPAWRARLDRTASTTDVPAEGSSMP